MICNDHNDIMIQYIGCPSYPNIPMPPLQRGPASTQPALALTFDKLQKERWFDPMEKRKTVEKNMNEISQNGIQAATYGGLTICRTGEQQNLTLKPAQIWCGGIVGIKQQGEKCQQHKLDKALILLAQMVPQPANMT